jgi:hypothetical protein
MWKTRAPQNRHRCCLTGNRGDHKSKKENVPESKNVLVERQKRQKCTGQQESAIVSRRNFAYVETCVEFCWYFGGRDISHAQLTDIIFPKSENRAILFVCERKWQEKNVPVQTKELLYPHNTLTALCCPKPPAMTG